MEAYEGCPRPTDTLLAREWIIEYIFLDNLPPYLIDCCRGKGVLYVWRATRHLGGAELQTT